MADSDIQFLGNWTSQQASSNATVVSAIVLTPVSPSTTSSPPDAPRTFSRTQTSVVHVGRGPATDPALALPADDKASFANPVMSRKHAKITFADSGSAFVIDTNSHHGTWVARAAAPHSAFKLAPESPVQLQDGDRITFGKEVQKNGTCHEPLAVAVKLLRTAASPSTMSISSATSSPGTDSASPKARNRFALDPSSDSDSDASSDSEAADKVPCTGPNAIRVDLPFKRPPGLGTPRSPGSPRFSPGSPRYSPSSTPRSPGSPRFSPGSPRFSPGSPRYSPGLELDGMTNPNPIPSLPRAHLNAPGTSADFAVDIDLDALPFLPDPPNALPGPDATPNPNPGADAGADPTTPPWRRPSLMPWSSLNAALNAPPPAPQPQPQPQRRIGRLLNPLWVRSSRGAAVGGAGEGADDGSGPLRRILARDVDVLDRVGDVEERDGAHGRHAHGSGVGHAHGREHGHGRRGRLDADWGLFGQSGSDVRDAVQRLEERVDAFAADVSALKARRDDGGGVHTRLGDLASQLTALQDAQQTALREAQQTSAADSTALRASLAAQAADVAQLRGRVDSDGARVRESGERVSDEVAGVQGEVAGVRGEVEGVRGVVAGVRAEVGSVRNEVRGVAGEVQQLKAAHAAAAHDLRARIREELRAEMEAQAQAQISHEQPSKRKRALDDAEPEVPVASPAPAPASASASSVVSRPRKRLRIVADCAAAGAVGALGAWMGLAFM